MANEPSEQSPQTPQSSPPPERFVSRIRQWPRSRQLSLLGVTLLCLVVFGYLIMQARVADYQLLYADLSQAEASSVVNWLESNNIPYQLKQQGQAIYIPADQVYKTRLDLAGDGLPKGQSVGFEIFDRQRFGVTRFTQQVNYQRALQGELARSVATLDAVKSARVHLVIPERRFFREKQKPAKASVVVGFEPGRGLEESQIQGIIRLVSGSVEGLQPENVTVVDEQGRVLSGGGSKDEKQTLTPENLAYKQNLESKLEGRAQALLDRIFGKNKAMVRVTADIDFVQKKSTEELYDPKSLVPRSEKTTKKVSSQQTGGAAGAASNMNGNTNGGGQGSSEKTETVNYEISRTVNEITKDKGGVKSLSVAVLLDQQFLKSQQAANGNGQTVDSIRRLVSGALGLDKNRGDVIEVVAMPLTDQGVTTGGTAASSGFSLYRYLPFIKYGLLCIGFVLAYLFLVRPLLRSLRGESVQEHYKTVSEMEGELQSVRQDPTEQLRQEIAQSEVTPAQIVKAWLKDR